MEEVKDKKVLHRTFTFDVSGKWTPIDDPLPEFDGDYDKMLRTLGFFECDLIDPGMLTLATYENTREDAPYPFLVDAGIGDTLCSIFVSDFPALFELLHKLSSYATLTLINSAYDSFEALRFDEMKRTDQRRAETRAQHRRLMRQSEKGAA